MNPKKGPSTFILVTGAVCFSIILAAVSYKATLSQAKVQKISPIAGISGTTTPPSELITNALQDAQLDAIANADNFDSANPFAIQPNDTVSDRFAKTLFTGYMYADQTDGVTDDSINTVNQAVFSNIKESDFPKTQFLTNQVKVFTPTSKAEIEQYGTAISTIILQNFKIIQANQSKYSENVKELAKIYKKIGNELILQRTPVELQIVQVNLANAYYLSGSGMEMIVDQDKDPVKAMLGLKVTKETNQLQADMLINIATYLNKNAIIFTNKESGVFWSQVLDVKNEENSQETTPSVN